MEKYIGIDIQRKDGQDKVHGSVRYAGDLQLPGMLHAVLLTSPHAHARIVSIDTSRARKIASVRGVVTGTDFPFLIGLYLGDKPPLAVSKVRHFGEAVAAVVADSEEIARSACRLIKVSYKPLKPLRTPKDALAKGAPILHEDLASYTRISAILPEPGSNVANRTRIRKGDIKEGFRQAESIIEEEFSLLPGDHVAMEPRVAIAEVHADGRVFIHSSTQSPFVVRNILSRSFRIEHGKITVIAHRVGGGFGGKAGIQLEGLAYLLSKGVGGRPVRVANSREQDMTASPGRPGLQARVKLGATRDGALTAADILFLFDSGAYADYAVNVSRAAGYMCTGPYRVPNVKADSLCVYTNHPFATAYRGFGHIELAFVIERAMDLLAEKLSMDPVELRLKNAILPGDTTPTKQVLNHNTGNLPSCISKVAKRLEWARGHRKTIMNTPDVNGVVVRSRGIACFWKAPAIPTNTDAGTILTFNEDGSVNLITGIVEIGTGTQTALAQIVAERLGIDPGTVHVVPEVMTDRSPHDWTTAASRSLFMAGNAAISAVEDVLDQIKKVASVPLCCPKDDLEVAGGKVFPRDNPEKGLPLKEVVLGYVFPNGNAIGGPIIGKGRYIARHLTGIDPETGEGNPCLDYTLGAEGVEVEVDLNDGSYKILKAVCTMDVGKVINEQLARGQVVGGIAMGLGFSTQEVFRFDGRERVQNAVLRDYKTPRYGDHPEYIVDFIETPQRDGPYGARGLGEQGVLGIPGALANALSRAIGRPLNHLPLTPENIWSALKGNRK